MAENYTQATVSPLLHVSEEALGWLSDLQEYEWDDEPIDPELLEKFPASWFSNDGTIVEDMKQALRDTSTECHPDGLYVFYEYGFSDEHASEILQWILLHSQEEYCYVEGASSCSKMQQGEFGGFACFLHKLDGEVLVEWTSTSDWIRCQVQNFNDRQIRLKNFPED